MKWITLTYHHRQRSWQLKWRKTCHVVEWKQDCLDHCGKHWKCHKRKSRQYLDCPGFDKCSFVVLQYCQSAEVSGNPWPSPTAGWAPGKPQSVGTQIGWTCLFMEPSAFKKGKSLLTVSKVKTPMCWKLTTVATLVSRDSNFRAPSLRCPLHWSKYYVNRGQKILSGKTVLAHWLEQSKGSKCKCRNTFIFILLLFLF